MIRFLIWILLIYIFFKLAKYVLRIMSGTAEKNEPIKNGRSNDNNKKPYSINQKDIVDADFTEIKENKDKKTGE